MAELTGNSGGVCSSCQKKQSNKTCVCVECCAQSNFNCTVASHKKARNGRHVHRHKNLIDQCMVEQKLLYVRIQKIRGSSSVSAIVPKTWKPDNCNFDAQDIRSGQLIVVDIWKITEASISDLE
eukprot:TRINITY_DN810_c0_g2_i18.p1 TRINITY_DN810_c0_g2~~TRINITY_DN810_c0_g2_i18.p1  ORF type:complete len:124 (-),score=0.42 TRINITY_DN810_c0_g2_i18:29-400(-)